MWLTTCPNLVKVPHATGNLHGKVQQLVYAQSGIGFLGFLQESADVLVLHVLGHQQPRLARYTHSVDLEHAGKIKLEHKLGFAKEVFLLI